MKGILENIKLPQEPGIYKFYDQEKKLIYVGKAKNIKNRVSSYFNKGNTHSRKTLKLVSEIDYIEFTIVNSEFDALLLENNLIKEYQPKYNIQLRDDKTYPFICITNEPFPKVISIRTQDPEFGTYYGPFASVRAMKNVLELLRKLYTIRTCNLQLIEKNIQGGKFKVCLEFHIGNCKGPCVGHQTENDYDLDIQQVHQILKGKLNIVRNTFKTRMQAAAESLHFEKAQVYKEKLQLLEKFQSKSTVVNPNISDVDVFSILSDEKFSYISYLKVMDGTVVQTFTKEIKRKLDESEEEILLMLIVELREKFQSRSAEVLANIPIESEIEDFSITVPFIGDKKKLVDLALKNGLYFKKEKAEEALNKLAETREDRVLLTLQKDLRLLTVPRHIECFDNSNIQGTSPVSSMVCFKNARPSKKEYRHYNVKTVEGANDFATMKEIVFRRYTRLLTESEPLPDLIVVDGGKGQLSSAVEALQELNIYGKIPIIGIAKRLEEIYYPEDNFPLYIDKKSESMRLLQRIRDEAHRFAITFHRQKRSKKSLTSSLENISGVGKSSIDKLLKTFKTIQRIKEAPVTEVEAILGKDRTQKLLEALNKKEA